LRLFEESSSGGGAGNDNACRMWSGRVTDLHREVRASVWCWSGRVLVLAVVCEPRLGTC
jgi:hypothetical protein